MSHLIDRTQSFSGVLSICISNGVKKLLLLTGSSWFCYRGGRGGGGGRR